jgi:hypothetical protein
MREVASVEEWLEVRKQAGLAIDPQAADVMWEYGDIGDPYGVDPDSRADCVGRNYFARAVGSDVWVEFGDLPEATREGLWKKHERNLCFPAGLPPNMPELSREEVIRYAKALARAKALIRANEAAPGEEGQIVAEILRASAN